jgi:hypothetical protein
LVGAYFRVFPFFVVFAFSKKEFWAKIWQFMTDYFDVLGLEISVMESTNRWCIIL